MKQLKQRLKGVLSLVLALMLLVGLAPVDAWAAGSGSDSVDAYFVRLLGSIPGETPNKADFILINGTGTVKTVTYDTTGDIYTYTLTLNPSASAGKTLKEWKKLDSIQLAEANFKAPYGCSSDTTETVTMDKIKGWLLDWDGTAKNFNKAERDNESVPSTITDSSIGLDYTVIGEQSIYILRAIYNYKVELYNNNQLWKTVQVEENTALQAAGEYSLPYEGCQWKTASGADYNTSANVTGPLKLYAVGDLESPTNPADQNWSPNQGNLTFEINNGDYNLQNVKIKPQSTTPGLFRNGLKLQKFFLRDNSGNGGAESYLPYGQTHGSDAKHSNLELSAEDYLKYLPAGVYDLSFNYEKNDSKTQTKCKLTIYNTSAQREGDPAIIPSSANYNSQTNKVVYDGREGADIEIKKENRRDNGHLFTGIKELTEETDYTVNNADIRIKNSCFKDMSATKRLTFQYSDGKEVSFTIYRNNQGSSSITNPTVDPDTATFDKAKPVDLTFTKNDGDFTFQKLSLRGKDLDKDQYQVDGNKVTVSQKYLMGLANGIYSLHLDYNDSRYAETLLTIKGEPVTSPGSESGGGGNVYYRVTYTDGVAAPEGSPEADAGKYEIFKDQVYTVTAGALTPAFQGTVTREGYKQTGWTPKLAETVTGDAIYTATWAKHVRPSILARQLLNANVPEDLDTINYEGQVLTKDKDYTVVFTNKTNGKIQADISFQGDYYGVGLKMLPNIRKGDKITKANITYKVKNVEKRTVKVVKAANKKNLTVKGHVTIRGWEFKTVAVGKKAFAKLSKLKEVHCPKTVAELDEKAFAHDHKLKKAVVYGKVSIAEDAFLDVKDGCKLIIKGSKKRVFVCKK